MGRRLRYTPPGGCLVEVSNRTVHGLHLLRPSAELHLIVLGLLARGKRVFGVQIHAHAFLSNHYHMLLTVRDSLQLSRFMGWFDSKLAREICRLYDWSDKVWARRYHHAIVSDEEEAQVARLRYILAQGCKEHLVERPQDWPGAHCARALLSGEAQRGLWFDRTREGRARARGETVSSRQFATEEELILEPLPCWVEAPEPARRGWIADLLQEIEAAASEDRATSGRSIAAPAAIEEQPPSETSTPLRSRRPAPLFHAFRREVRQRLYDAYRLFVAAFREAASRLRRGELAVAFPSGSFPPGAPFVGIPLPAS